METEELDTKRPYLVTRRFDPRKVNETPSPETTEGIVLSLTPEGKLDPQMVPAFIVDFNVAAMPDGRTTVVVARLRNNYLVSETISSLTKEDYDQDAAIEVCKNKIYDKVWHLLQFLWATGTVTTNMVKEDYAIQGQVAVDATTGEEIE